MLLSSFDRNPWDHTGLEKIRGYPSLFKSCWRKIIENLCHAWGIQDEFATKGCGTRHRHKQRSKSLRVQLATPQTHLQIPTQKKTTGVPMLLCCFMVSSAVLQVHLSPGIKLRFCQNICTAWIDMTWADFSRGASRRPQLWSFWMGSPARPLWAPSSLVLCDGRGTWHGTGSGCKNEPENCHDMSWLEAKTHTRTNINIGTAWSRSWYFSGTNIY